MIDLGEPAGVLARSAFGFTSNWRRDRIVYMHQIQSAFDILGRDDPLVWYNGGENDNCA